MPIQPRTSPIKFDRLEETEPLEKGSRYRIFTLRLMRTSDELLALATDTARDEQVKMPPGTAEDDWGTP